MNSKSGSENIIANLLTSRTGQELTKSRSWRIGSALSGIFREKGISNVDQLVCLLDQPGHAALSQQIVEALLNNETYFFRDRAMFNQLIERVLPQLQIRRAERKKISILCTGCSTGQEALSLAMIFLEQEALWSDWQIEITGIDVSHNAIASARSGTYSQFEIQRGLSVTQMLAHFNETPMGWETNEKLRNMIQFRVHNILSPMPAAIPFDLILCRNVMLYFDLNTRKSVFGRLIENLSLDGWVMLGAGETVVGGTDQLVPVERGISLYRPLNADQKT